MPESIYWFVPLCVWYRKILAVVEHGNDRKPTISIYDLVKSVHLQRLTIPLKMEADNFMKIQFSCDDVYLAALSEEPDYIMYYFNWRMAKVDSRIRVIKPPLLLGPVYDVIFSYYIDNNDASFITHPGPVTGRVLFIKCMST